MADDTPEVVRLAAGADQLIRQINHATIAGDGGITWPSDLERAVRSLAAMAHKLPQALRQFARIAETTSTRGGLYDDRLPETPGAGAGCAQWAAAELIDAISLAGHLAGALDQAAEQLSHLGVRDG